MDKLILIGIGALALGYVVRLVWRNIKGEPTCSSCGSCGGCKDKK